MKIFRKTIAKKLLENNNKKDVKRLLKLTRDFDDFADMYEFLTNRLIDNPEEKEIIESFMSAIMERIDEINDGYEQALKVYNKMTQQLDDKETFLDKLLNENNLNEGGVSNEDL